MEFLTIVDSELVSYDLSVLKNLYVKIKETIYQIRAARDCQAKLRALYSYD